LLSEVVSEKPLKTFERRHLEFYRKLVCLIVSDLAIFLTQVCNRNE